MTATSILERAGELVERKEPAGPSGPVGGIYNSKPGVSVSRGLSVRDTVRTTPSVRNNPAIGVPAPTYGGTYSTAPNPQILIQRQPTILYRQPVLIPHQQFQQPQPGAIGSRTTTVNPPKAPQTSKGGMNATGAGAAQSRTINPAGGTASTPPALDKRINYGSGSPSSAQKKTMKLN